MALVAMPVLRGICRVFLAEKLVPEDNLESVGTEARRHHPRVRVISGEPVRGTRKPELASKAGHHDLGPVFLMLRPGLFEKPRARGARKLEPELPPRTHRLEVNGGTARNLERIERITKQRVG